METYQQRMSITRLPHLDSSNYGYWKVQMQAFISGLDENCWSSIEFGWSHPVMVDDKKVEVLKPRNQWTVAEKKTLNCNSKDKTSTYNVIDASHFKLIFQYAWDQKAWKTLENMFEGTTNVKLVETYSVLAKEKVKLKAQVVETLICLRERRSMTCYCLTCKNSKGLKVLIMGRNNLIIFSVFRKVIDVKSNFKGDILKLKVFLYQQKPL